jgi:hypothetical protein
LHQDDRDEIEVLQKKALVTEGEISEFRHNFRERRGAVRKAGGGAGSRKIPW